MPWFRVDDNLAFHHKVVAAGNPAMGLWVRCGSLCSQQLTDGFVPDHMIVAMGTKAQAEKLVSVGLWDRAQGGYRFHGWSERQPSKVSVEAERAAAADRMREYRAKKKGTSQEAPSQVSDVRSGERPANERRTNAEVRRSFANPNPTHPSPDPPITTRKRVKRQLPDDFRPSDKHVTLAQTEGVDLQAEWPKFCDHHIGKGTLMLDWDAALRTWIRNAKKFSNVRHLPPADDTSWMRRRPQ